MSDHAGQLIEPPLLDTTMRLGEFSSDAVLATNPGGEIVYANDKTTELFEWSRDELHGRSVDTLIPSHLRTGHHDHIRQFAVEGSSHRHLRPPEMHGVNRSGREFPVSVTVSRLSNDNDTLLIAAVRDISEQINTLKALAAAEEHLRRAQKLEAIGQLAAGVAHEINTPIQYIADNARYLEETFNELVDGLRSRRAAIQPCDVVDSNRGAAPGALSHLELDVMAAEAADAFADLLDGVGHVATVVSALTKLSTPTAPADIQGDLNEIITDSVTVTRSEWKKYATVTLDLDAALPSLLCQPNELAQVFVNLIVNAAQAFASSGTSGDIRIRTWRAQGSIVAEVADNGPGIPQQNRERVFDPFFSTKDVGKGTGQGLALVHRVIVDQHGGMITLCDDEGSGARFLIEIPVSSR